MKARVIAIYLPQFHPVAENDRHWGKGFTEWNNVVKARPLFPGHFQPKLPADLGFYDLRLPEVREAQAQMARDAGIEGFMYWHYWFGSGRKVLERPFEEVVASGKPDFPFCLGWANHSWTNRTWTKQKGLLQSDSMIFEQTYPGEVDDRAHFDYLLPAFRDKRYIKVDGKLFFAIWNPDEIPHLRQFLSLWQHLAREHGLNGFHFVAMRTLRTSSPRESLIDCGFDAVNNSNFAMWRAEMKCRMGSLLLKRGLYFLSDRLNLPLQCYNYKSIIKWLCDDDDRRQDTYPTLLPGYDRSPRSGRRAQIYYNNTPELWGRHVDDVLDHVKDKDEEHRIVLLKSWNEWGEGNYIEPDCRYGMAYLDVLRDKLK